jgi:hypothetical protein
MDAWVISAVDLDSVMGQGSTNVICFAIVVVRRATKSGQTAKGAKMRASPANKSSKLL